MRSLYIALVFLILISCTHDDTKYFVMDAELQESRWLMQIEMNDRFKCFETLFIHTDSTYNPQKPKGQTQIFYTEFKKLKDFRDSIAGLTKEAWISLLLNFEKRAGSLMGTERSKLKIQSDIKFLKENFDKLPESKVGELYKHTIERWIRETYNSILSNVAIDFVEGYKMPCSF